MCVTGLPILQLLSLSTFAVSLSSTITGNLAFMEQNRERQVGGPWCRITPLLTTGLGLPLVHFYVQREPILTPTSTETTQRLPQKHSRQAEI